VVEGGNRFDVSRVVIHQTLDNWPQGRETRGWDLASSSKERDKSDPDWTWGIRGHVRRINNPCGVSHEVWIRSMVACRAEAPERDALMRATAQNEGFAGGFRDSSHSPTTAPVPVLLLHVPAGPFALFSPPRGPLIIGLAPGTLQSCMNSAYVPASELDGTKIDASLLPNTS